MIIWKTLLLGYLGGMAYAGLELLWRRRTHWSMFLLGGLCFLLIGRLRRFRLPTILRGGLCAAMITVLELLTGLLVNRDHSVWDYRRRRIQFKGQICLAYSLLWIPVSLMAMKLYDWLDRWVFRLTFGKYHVK